MIANLDPFGPPLIADMDTGYGGKMELSLKPVTGSNIVQGLSWLRELSSNISELELPAPILRTKS